MIGHIFSEFENLRKEVNENLDNMKGMWKFCVYILENLSPQQTSHFVPLTPPNTNVGGSFCHEDAEDA